MGVLSAIVWAPLVAAAIIVLLPKESLRAIQAVALAGAAAAFALSWSLLARFDPAQAGPQFRETLAWVPEMGMTYSLGLDSISLPMTLLTTLLALVSVVASCGSIGERVKAYFAWFMFMEFAILGVFAAQDWFLFYMFWEVTLIPMFFLIGIWGGERKSVASMSFFLYTLAGSVFMLLGLIAAYLATPAPHTFDMAEMARAHGAWGREFQIAVFLAFFLGMAVKIPSFPLHGWLPLAHVEAPIPVSMMLSGVLLKMGAYGLLRVLDLVPQGVQWFLPFLLALGMVNIVYGSLMAFRQHDLKAMVAFSSISHMGFVMIGTASLTMTGLTGAVMQMFTHGVITAALFLLVGALYERSHSRMVGDFAGLSHQVPKYSVVMTIALLASMGLPGLAGFISEFHALVGAFERWGLWVLFAAIGILVTAAYSLRTINSMLLGTPNPKWDGMKDLSLRETLAVAPLVVLMIALGLFPSAALNLMSPALTGIVAAANVAAGR